MAMRKYDFIVESIQLAQREGLNLLLWGPPGTSKSTMARNVFDREIKKEVFQVSLSEGTSAAELRGYDRIDSEGKFKFFEGACTQARRKGSRLILNEVHRAYGDAMDYLLAVLDSSEVGQEMAPDGSIIKIEKGFHVIATSNVDPKHMSSDALVDRFDMTVHVDSPPVEVIKQCFDNRQGDVYKAAMELRKKHEHGADIPVSLRPFLSLFTMVQQQRMATDVGKCVRAAFQRYGVHKDVQSDICSLVAGHLIDVKEDEEASAKS